MAEAVSELDMNITCNELLSLAPSKSVVFCADCKTQRGTGHGKNVYFAQFLKGGESGEIEFMQSVSSIINRKIRERV